MAPAEVRNVLSKCSGLGANQILITERGTSFGYHNLVVDPLSFPILKSFNVPSSSTSLTRADAGCTGRVDRGRGQFVEDLSVMAAAAGIALCSLSAIQCAFESALRWTMCMATA